MKKTALLSIFLFFSLFVASCNDDDDDDSNSNGPSNNNPPAENSDPTFTAFISGDITDTISFTIAGGIQTSESIIGSYVGVSDLLTMNVMQLPTGFQISMVGLRDSFGEGDYVGGQPLGFGGYTDSALGRAFIGTSSTITFESTELVQNVVLASYNVDGSFSITMEDNSMPPRVIVMNGTFENIPISVNE